MSTQILLIEFLAPVIGYFVWKKIQTPQKPVPTIKRAGTSKSVPKKKQAPHAYKCIEIKTCLMACKAVGKYKSKRLLISESPMLPVPGCDSKECECKFLRYDDRRKGDRRSRVTTAASQIISEHSNKRVRTDRRKPKSP
jgi:hypothetical protein